MTKTKSIKTIIMFLLMLAMIFCGFAGLGAITASAANASSYDISSASVTIDNSCGDNCAGHTITGTTTSNTVTVSGGTHNITITDLNINVTTAADYTSAFAISSEASVNLTLNGTNVLKSGRRAAGLQVPSGASLVITAESTGSIEAVGGEWSAGIGGSSGYSSGGTIIINGGTVTASAGKYGAGIGGGNFGTSTTITINGGTVTAKGGDNGAGIGCGGSVSNSGIITINGGTVTAQGGLYGAGIGGSSGYSSGGTIIINGGMVTATGGHNGAGIGDGESSGAKGSFSTGDNGNAVIVASSISTTTDQDSWNGIINYTMFGTSVTPTENFEIPAGKTLTIADGQTLTVAEGITLTNNGTIDLEEGGELIVDDTLTNDGAIILNGTITENGTISGTGINVYVKNIHNEEPILFNVSLTDTISALKSKIFTAKAIPVGKQTLTFASTTLEDDKTFDDYNIQKDSTIHLTVKHTVTFDANGGASTMNSVIVTEGESYTLPANGFTAPNGYMFKAWSVGGTEYAVGENFTVTDDTVITAVWERVVVSFNANGGSCDTLSSEVTDEYKLSFLPIPTHDTLCFAGWFDAAEGGNQIEQDAVFKTTTTIYAQWKAHAWNEGVVTTQPTCTDKGVKTFTCQSDNSHTYTEDVAIDADAHAWNEGAVTTDPTCSAVGVKTFTCQHDNSHTCTEDIAIDTNAHSIEYSATGNVLAAVCTLCDYTEKVTLNAPSALTYDKTAKTASTEGTITDATVSDITYCCDSGCINAGKHTATVTVAVGDAEYTLKAEFAISPITLTVAGAEVEDRNYDGTDIVVIKDVHLDRDAIIDGDLVNLSVDFSNATARLPSVNAGSYSFVSLSGLVLSGESAGNYVLASEAESVPLQNYWGYDASVYISELQLIIEVEDQSLMGDAALDQTKYTVEGLPEGFELSNVILYEADGKIYVDEESIKITANGEDVTENFWFMTNSANLSRVCEGHTFNEDGFCSTGNCDTYQEAALNNNGTPDEEWDDYYEIYTAGQLYWFAENVNKYGLSLGVKLMNDITVNEGIMSAESTNARPWTPISDYYANFDGNGKTISGLYCISEGNNVGFFGNLGYYSVTDLHISNSYFEGNEYVGAIAGSSDATIERCSVDTTVTVVGNRYVGGLVGSAYGSINNCYSFASVRGENIVGGIIGYSYADFHNCFTTASNAASNISSSYGSCSNVYYLGDVDDGYNGTTAVTLAQLASGEIAYLLQAGVTGEEYWDDDLGEWVVKDPEHIWGQLVGTDAYPVLGGAQVYYGYTTCSASQTEMIYSNNSAASDTKPSHKVSETLTNDGEQHFYACTVSGCEHKVDIEECNGGAATCIAKAICDVCGNEYGGLVDHSWSEKWDYKISNGHAHGCTVDGCDEHDEIQPHTPDIAAPTEQQAQLCSTCGYQMQAALGHTHSPASTWTSNATHHWKACSGCSEHIEEAQHDYDNDCDTTCDVCGATRTVAHDFTGAWQKDASGHWHVCADGCGTTDTKEAHVSAGAATETNPEVCSICGWQIAPALGHQHSSETEWQKNDTTHWNNCTGCNEKLNDAAHTYGEWVETTPATETTAGEKERACSVCGFEQIETIPATGGGTVTPPPHTHSHGSTWVTDEDEHWNECSCGDKANKAAHADGDNNGECDTCGYTMSTGTVDPGTDTNPPVDNPTSDDNDGLGTGGIIGIVVASVAAVGGGGFALFWFVFRKKRRI